MFQTKYYRKEQLCCPIKITVFFVSALKFCFVSVDSQERKTHRICSILLTVVAYLLKKGLPYEHGGRECEWPWLSLQLDGVQTSCKSYAKQVDKCTAIFEALPEVGIKIVGIGNSLKMGSRVFRKVGNTLLDHMTLYPRGPFFNKIPVFIQSEGSRPCSP